MFVDHKPAGWEFLVGWILASAAGLAIGFGLARAVALTLGGEIYWDTGAPSYGRVNGTLAWIVAGAAVGLAQWLVLRRRAQWSGWWPIGVILFLCAQALWPATGDGRITMPFIPGGVMGGAVFGAITGVPTLAWLRLSGHQSQSVSGESS